MFRWPWRRPALATAPSGGATGGEPPATAAPAAAAGPPAWPDAPPVQRVVDAMPLTAPVERLTSSLATWAHPSFLAPLGHVVDPVGPSGRVDGLVRPGGPLTQPAVRELPLRPTTGPGRRTRMPVQRAGVLSPTVDAAPGPDPVPSGSSDSGAVGEPPALRLPVADPRLAAPPPPLTTATTVPLPTVPRPVVAGAVQPSDVQRTWDVQRTPEVQPSGGVQPPGGVQLPAEVEPSPEAQPVREQRAVTGGQRAEEGAPPVSAAAGGAVRPDRVLPVQPLLGDADAPANGWRDSAPADEPPPLHPPLVGPGGRPRRSRIGAPLTGPLDLQRVASEDSDLPALSTSVGAPPLPLPEGGAARRGSSEGGDPVAPVLAAEKGQPPVEPERTGGLPPVAALVQRSAGEDAPPAAAGPAPAGPVLDPIGAVEIRPLAGAGAPDGAMAAVGDDSRAVGPRPGPLPGGGPLADGLDGLGPPAGRPTQTGLPLGLQRTPDRESPRSEGTGGRSPVVAGERALRAEVQRQEGLPAPPGPLVPSPTSAGESGTAPLPLRPHQWGSRGQADAPVVQRLSPDPSAAVQPDRRQESEGGGPGDRDQDAAWHVVAPLLGQRPALNRLVPDAMTAPPLPALPAPHSASRPVSLPPTGAAAAAVKSAAGAPRVREHATQKAPFLPSVLGVQSAPVAAATASTYASLPRRLPMASTGPTTAPQIGPSWAPAPTPHAATPVQRSTYSSRPADPGSAAVAAGVASRDPDGSVVFLPPPQQASPDGPPLAASWSSPEGWGGSAAPVSTSSPQVATVQRQVAADPPPGGPSPAPAGAPAGSTADRPPDPSGSAAATPTDLDELARRLFDPLSARLRAELRLDRERAGVVTDLRH